MRQVGRDELAYVLTSEIRQLPRAVLRDLTDPRRPISDRAKAIAASRIADALRRYEILTPAPSAPDETFSVPLLRMMGVELPSGAPAVARPDES